ncbi:MAG: DEAD/DEAH box helicase [Acidobacteria bacterium]|nr:DEAD/DEAH box helicase [Acidobacteriota bacterium]
MAAIDAGSSVVVAAPTGAGKTVIAEHAVESVLASGGRLFYTTPIKALSNQKFRDLVSLHGSDAVGLLTGDIAVRRDARIVVMTTEVLRNMTYSNPEELHDLAWVVLDEIHYLSDPHRGPVWEEVIIHLPAHVHVVGLSATISNSTELTDWIRSVRGPTNVVVETERPIELEHRYAVASARHDPIELVALLRKGRFDRSNKRFDTSRGGGGRKKRAGERRDATNWSRH